MNNDAHILVVDDDERLRNLLQRYLSQHGHIVSVAADVASARAKLAGIDYDLVVVDVMMPGEDGLSLTRSLKRETSTPVLLLTARGEGSDRIRGLEAGADDYLTKPFEPRELLLRIANILKHHEPSDGGGNTVTFGEYRYFKDSGELYRRDELIHLTSGEQSLLATLASHPGEALSRMEIGQLSKVSGSDRAIDVQMTRLRRKLEDDPRQPRYLLTLRGEGYVLRLGR